MKRRAYLGLLGAGVLAGCSGGESDDEAGDNTTDNSGGSTDTPAGTDTPGDGETDSKSEEDSPADPSAVAFSRLWEEEFGSGGTIRGRNFAADATSAGVFAGADWGFVALGLDDGSRMWETDEWDGFFDIHADSDGVVAYTRSFEVVSFDPSDGTEQWRVSTTESESPALNTALTPSYFVAEDGDGITVYDRSSGDSVVEIDEPLQDVVATDDVLVGLKAAEVAAYDITSGSERWRDRTILSPGAVIVDGRLIGQTVGFGPNATSSLKAIDLDSGDEVWSEEVSDLPIGGSPLAVENGVAVFLAGSTMEERTVYAHDIENGTELWSQNVGQLTDSFSPATDSGVVIAPAVTENRRSQVRAYNVQNGDELDATSGGLSVNEALAVDRVFLEIGLSSVTAIEF